MAEEQPDYRQELYDRFRAEISRPVTDRYYTAEDLIEIFDFAGDYNDVYVQLEVLLLGARLYPDDGELAERRAILYLNYDDTAFKNYVGDHAAEHSNLWSIIRLNLLTPGQDSTKAALEKFLRSAGELSDEEIIQFIDMAVSLEIDEWLFEHVDMLREHCTYLPTLLYELAGAAERNEKYEHATRFLEELTQIEPFNPDYWTMLASNNILRSRQDEAASNIEYALAIDPENIEALRVKAATFAKPEVRGEFGRLIDKVLTRIPDDEDIAYMAIIQGIEEKDIEYVHGILARVADSIKDSYRIVEKAIESGYKGLPVMLDNLYAAGKTQADEWIRLSDLAYMCGNYSAASLIMFSYQNNSGRPLGHDLLLYRLLYSTGQYADVVKLFLSVDSDNEMRYNENMYITVALFIMSLLREGEVNNALETAQSILDLFSQNISMPGDAFAQFGMRTFLADVIEKGRANPDFDWKTYNPLGLS